MNLRKLHNSIAKQALVGRNCASTLYLLAAGRWSWGMQLLRGARKIRKPKTPLRLHLGCGNRRQDGFVNVDLHLSHATDYVADIKNLPCPSASVERIECYHVIEHIPHREVAKYVDEWHRLLEPEGKLVVECPDFDRAVEEYLAGNEERLFNIYGRQRFPGDTHRYGYNSARLKMLLEEAGFSSVTLEEPQDYHAKQEPCLRAVAVKPG